MSLLVRVTLFLFISYGPLLCLAEPFCLPDLIGASNLQELLTIAQALPNVAETNLAKRQDDVRKDITALNNSLNARMDVYVDKLRGQAGTFDNSCAPFYYNGIYDYESGVMKIEEAMTIDVVKRVRNEYTSKFEANVQFIQEKIQECKQNCTEKQSGSDIKEAKTRMLKTQDDWCYCTKMKLEVVSEQAMNGYEQGELGFNLSERWMNLWGCEYV